MIFPGAVALIYGALVLAGGWVGYRRAGSRPSLITGTASGLTLAVATALTLAGRPAGIRLAQAVSLSLLMFFSYRLARSRKFMPAGLMAILSLAALALLWISRPI